MAGSHFSWDIPSRHLLCLANPTPVSDNNLMRRIGLLIKDLSAPQWKLRESASSALKELGPLAKSSLKKALKTSTDAEVTHRLEDLLRDND